MAPTAAPEQLLTVRQVAERLQLSESAVYQKLARRELASIKLGPGPKARVRIPLAELALYLRAGRVA